MKPNMAPPTVSEEEITPTVLKLLAYIEQQAYIIQQLKEDIQRLKDEIARLKKQPPRPKIRPSQLEKKGSGKKKRKGKKRPGSEKRAKTAELIIHETQPIEPENLPAGSVFKYDKPFVVQDIRIEPHNIRYLLKVYQTPEGRLVAGKLPEQFNQKHFGPTLICFILYQYYNCHVTQPLLLEQLLELGVDISAGQLNNILIEDKERYHQEKDQILATALQVSSFVNVDDTGARHKGNNGYCTHIGNELFSWFESTGSKSRINFCS